MPYTWGPWVQLSDYTAAADVLAGGYASHSGHDRESGRSASLSTDQGFMDTAVATALANQHSLTGGPNANVVERTSGNIPRGVVCTVDISPANLTLAPDLAPPDVYSQWPSDVPVDAVGYEFADALSVPQSGELDWFVGIRDDRNVNFVCAYTSDIYVAGVRNTSPYGLGTLLTTVTDGPTNANRYSLVDSGTQDITAIMAADGSVMLYNEYTAYTVTLVSNGFVTINHVAFEYNPTNDTTVNSTASWVLRPPLVRFQYFEPAVFAAPPCQLYPRDDDQGAGTGAIWPPPSSGRPGSYY